METTLFPGLDAGSKIKKPSKTHDSRVRDFLFYWCRLWKQKYGSDYIITWRSDGSIVKRLLKTLDAAQPGESLTALQTAAERLFNGGLKWFRGKESIGAFSRHINHLLDDQGGSHAAVRPTTEQLDAYDRIAR